MAVAITLRFAWKPLLMLFVLLGVISVRAMVAVVIGLVIVAAGT